MVKVVVSAEVISVEDLGFGVLSEEGVGAGVGYRIAYADGDRVEIEADVTLSLGVGRDGRQSENDDSGKVPKLH